MAHSIGNHSRSGSDRVAPSGAAIVRGEHSCSESDRVAPTGAAIRCERFVRGEHSRSGSARVSWSVAPHSLLFRTASFLRTTEPGYAQLCLRRVGPSRSRSLAVFSFAIPSL
jgi:hypothetical protein